MRALLIFVFVLMLAVPALGQTGPDYIITNIRPAQLSANGRSVLVVFDVNNQGRTATTNAAVRLIHQNTGEELASQSLRPLIQNEGVTVALLIPLETLQPDQAQTLVVSIELDPDSPVTENIVVPPLDELSAAPPLTTPATESGLETILRNLGFNLADPVHRAALIGVGIALLIILVLFLLILRLLFRRQPRFELHLPPYANVPPMAPSTNAGRRQGWQFHAQNDLPPPYPANEGSTHIRKLLVGVDGLKLGNWEITGMRMNQYDQYGRIARSEIVAAPRDCRRLSKTAEKAAGLSEEQISRRVRPVARALVGRFQRKINSRSAVLPIALDIAFQGVHGEVRIRFELFYMEQGRWRMVDAWEPEMTVAGRAIHENYTYSLSGLRQGEGFRTFARRLQDDLTLLLTDMLKHEQPVAGASRPMQRVEG
ncbi:MAG TPA: hypothetical protein VKY59_07490 [Spirillospora sp.]|nr:hypothetical protein [Spirillospora sp.]